MQPILKINLTTRAISEFRIPLNWEQEYLGGASLAARLLYSSLRLELDPLSAESPLLFLVGPLTGTAGPTVGRFVVCGKSPATGLWAESNCGGFWGPELRFTGYDGLWITGKAEKPVYLWLQDGRLEFREAGKIWGLDTYQSQEAIKKELGVSGTHVMAIGPAGENLVLFAGLFCDHGRTAGRTGLGAVAGAKNLKAIAVQGSQKSLPLARPDQYAFLRSEANRNTKADNVNKVLHDLGTSGVVDFADYLGTMPKKYYHRATMEAVDQVSGSTMSETLLKGVSACHACVVACGRVVDLGEGTRRKGPEYETIVGFGPNLLNTDLQSIVRLGELCDRYGMDTISTSNTIGLAYHLYDQGVLRLSDVGFPLVWGDPEGAERLIHLISRREGIGDKLANGSRRFGADFGAEAEAVQVNGLEVAYHDPRGVSGQALVYATSPRGACHNKSDYFFVDWGKVSPELGIAYFDQRAGAEKSANVAHHQDWRTVGDALVVCILTNVTAETTVNLINAACGLEWGIEEMMRSGERGWNLKRAINHRMGLTRSSDCLPKPLLEPFPDGPAAGFIPEIEGMLGAYYAARGWDPVSGRPTRAKLTSLGLEDVANDLWG